MFETMQYSPVDVQLEDGLEALGLVEVSPLHQ